MFIAVHRSDICYLSDSQTLHRQLLILELCHFLAGVTSARLSSKVKVNLLLVKRRITRHRPGAVVLNGFLITSASNLFVVTIALRTIRHRELSRYCEE